MPVNPFLRERSWFTGLLGLGLLPLLVIIDTAVALSRDWSPASAGTFGRLPIVAGLLLLGAISLCLLPSFRSLLSRYASRLWLCSSATLFALYLTNWSLSIDRPRPPYHLRHPNTQYIYDPDPFSVPGVIGEAWSSINGDGVRGPNMPADAYRVLCIGGSTTECLYLDDSESWPARLAHDLQLSRHPPVWVGAAGFSEYATAQHLKFLRESNLAGQVDAVVLLVGAGDLVRTLMQLGTTTAETPIWLRLAPVELVRETWNVTAKQGLLYDKTGESLRTMRLARPIRQPQQPIFWERELDGYRQRLAEVVRVTQQRQVDLLLVTQPVLWDESLSPYHARRYWLARTAPNRDWDALQPEHLRETIDRFNQVTREVAAEHRIPLVDAAAAMNGAAMCFYDDFHLNEAGCKQLAELIARQWPATWKPKARVRQ